MRVELGARGAVVSTAGLGGAAGGSSAVALATLLELGAAGPAVVSVAAWDGVVGRASSVELAGRVGLRDKGPYGW